MVAGRGLYIAGSGCKSQVRAGGYRVCGSKVAGARFDVARGKNDFA